MREEIRRIQRETGITTIFVTHDQKKQWYLINRRYERWRFTSKDKPQHVYNEPVDEFVAKFLGNPQLNY